MAPHGAPRAPGGMCNRTPHKPPCVLRGGHTPFAGGGTSAPQVPPPHSQAYGGHPSSPNRSAIAHGAAPWGLRAVYNILKTGHANVVGAWHFILGCMQMAVNTQRAHFLNRLYTPPTPPHRLEFVLPHAWATQFVQNSGPLPLWGPLMAAAITPLVPPLCPASRERKAPPAAPHAAPGSCAAQN